MTNQVDGWLTIREAAIRLRVSELTIRRRVKDGRVAHRLENGKYYVNLDIDAQAESYPSRLKRDGIIDQQVDRATDHQNDQMQEAIGEDALGPSRERPGPILADIDSLLAQQSRLAERAGRAAMLEEQLRRLEEQHVAAQERSLALASRNGWLESKLEEREQNLRVLTDSQRKISWWKRLLGAGGGRS